MASRVDSTRSTAFSCLKAYFIAVTNCSENLQLMNSWSFLLWWVLEEALDFRPPWECLESLLTDLLLPYGVLSGARRWDIGLFEGSLERGLLIFICPEGDTFFFLSISDTESNFSTGITMSRVWECSKGFSLGASPSVSRFSLAGGNTLIYVGF